MPDLNHGGFTPTDRINYAGSIAAGKRQRGYGSMAGQLTSAGSNPLEGLAEAKDEIIGASGLGRRAPDGPTRGEQMSDANDPEQEVAVDKDSDVAIHRKRESDGSVSETPVGSPAQDPWYKSHYGDSSGQMRDYSPAGIASNDGSAPLVNSTQFGSAATQSVNPD